MRRSASSPSRWLVVLLGLAAAPFPVSAAGQEEAPPDTARPATPGAEEAEGPRQARCRLVFEPASEDTESYSVTGPRGGYVTHVSGGMIWTCGNAVMEADSAVRYDVERRVELVGNVRYRDTIRTLESRRLDYYELPDRVIATGDVRLRRLQSGSVLTGPRVEFLRAVSGVNQLTVATGRPHMTLRPGGEGGADAADEGGELPPPGEEERPPFEVDADEAVFAGEEVAWASGDVVIERPDLRATADSAYFEVEAGVGRLFGDPVARGEAYELAGDSLHLAFDEDRLREVRALGRSRAEGEDFRVLSERILVRLEENQVESVRAYGGERAVAVSASYRVYGDSLRFAMAEGRIDTVVAIGSAAAVEDDTARELAPDPAAVTDADTAGAGPDTADVVDRDTAAVAAGDTEELAAGDTAGVAAGDTAAPGPPRELRIAPPVLRTEAGANWATGDTLYAIFEPVPVAEEDPDAPGAAEQAEDVEAAAGVEPAEDAEAAEAAPGEGADAPAAGAGEARLRLLRVVGNARSFYSAVRDSARTAEPSRNYLLGRQIEVHFADGEARRVVGTEAIGVYLEPAGEGSGTFDPDEGIPEGPEDAGDPQDPATAGDTLPPPAPGVR